MLLLMNYVHCRTGSLEIILALDTTAATVHCRTGSLESEIGGRVPVKPVHCRTGSLENFQPTITV